MGNMGGARTGVIIRVMHMAWTEACANGMPVYSVP